MHTEEDYEEEDGAHDTITRWVIGHLIIAWKNVTYNDDCSLAGAKMLQRYRTNISGSSRKGSLHRLESLFLIDEDDKEDPDEDTLEVEEQVLLKLF